MNKKLLNWISICLVGLTFLFTLIGIAMQNNGWKMCIIAMIFSLGALVCLLLKFFHKKLPQKTDQVEKPVSDQTPAETSPTTTKPIETTTM